MPESAKFSPAGIWRRKLNQSELMSPDHAVTEFLCDPAKAERDRMKTRFWSDALRCP